MNREEQIVEEAVRVARQGGPAASAGNVQPIQVEPVRLMFVASDPATTGVGLTPDGRKLVRIMQFPFEITILLSDEVKRALLTGLSGVEVPR